MRAGDAVGTMREITKAGWAKLPDDYKSTKDDGSTWMLTYDERHGTVLEQVKVVAR